MRGRSPAACRTIAEVPRVRSDHVNRWTDARVVQRFTAAGRGIELHWGIRAGSRRLEIEPGDGRLRRRQNHAGWHEANLNRLRAYRSKVRAGRSRHDRYACAKRRATAIVRERPIAR